jgi:hypothetical protein
MQPNSFVKLGRILFNLHLIGLTFAGSPASGWAQDALTPASREISIPSIDLDDQVYRQTVVDYEPDQYLGHPTTVLLEDGKTMLAVYPKGHGKGAIILKRSMDGGKTWSERLPTPKNWETSQETPTIYRTIDAHGNQRLILFSGLYPIRLSVSQDNGSSWTPLEAIGDFGGIVAVSACERLANGDYLALFHDDGRFLREGTEQKNSESKPFTVYKIISQDGGLSWSQPVAIASHPDAQWCEPGLIRSPDGQQILVLLRENSRKFNSFYMTSDDEGKSWTQPRQVAASLTGDRHTARYAPDGRLFISFRDMAHQSPTRGDWVGWVGTYDDIVNGRSGEYRIRIKDNKKGTDCAYPGVELLPDGTLVTTTYGHWSAGQLPYILCVRFHLNELDPLK